MNLQKDRILTRPIVVCLLAMICCALWGSAFPSIKSGYSLFQIPQGNVSSQILFAGIRFFFAGVLTVLFGSMANRRPLLPRAGSWKRIGILSGFQTILQYIPFYIGLAHASGVKSSILVGTNVFLSILVACLIFKQETLTNRKVLGSIIGFSGVVLVNLSGAKFSAELSFLGEGMILLSTVSNAFSSVLMKKFSRQDNPVLLSGYQFVLGGAVLAVLGFAAGGRITNWTAPGAFVLLYLAFLSAAAYSIWSILLKYNPVSRVTIFGFMNPVFGVILSAVILNEGQQAFGLKSLAALILVSLGIYIVNSAAANRCPGPSAN
ncbi:MAG: EamA family transporter [Oscillospiraceae bacterium]|jgi:drug/metabolite transporter (DMT)-like permease|nr:EamA family transporter [Oscillospiraceae bacterium]